MMITALLLSASALFELGTSPLADPGHQHDWVEIADQPEGETALHDRNWSKTIRQRGRTLNLILIRSDLTDEGAKVIMDVIIAADCRARKLGMSEAYMFRSPMGDMLEIKLDNIDMDLAYDPPSEDELAILAASCG